MKHAYYFLITSVIILSSFTNAQNPQWINYYSKSNVYSFAEDSNFIWSRSDYFLLKTNKKTGEQAIFDKNTFGLQDFSTSALDADSAGNIWISLPEYGLMKFDGKNQTIYNSSNSGLTSNYIRNIAIDKRGNIWISNIDGLVKFNGTNWTVYKPANSGIDVSYGFKTIAFDTSSNIWLGAYNSGLIKFDGVNWTAFTTANSKIPDNSVNGIAIDFAGNKWIGTNNGLAKFDGTNWTVYNSSNSGLPDNSINAVCFDIWGTAWISTNYGLVKFDGTNWTVYNSSNSVFSNNGIYSVKIDNNGNKWIACSDGIVKFDDINWTKFNSANSQLSGFVHTITIDNQNNAWIGCDGVVKLEGKRWTVYNRANSGLPSDEIEAIAIDNEGIKWFGAVGGLVRFDEQAWTSFNSDNSPLPNNTVSAIAVDKIGHKVIGTHSGAAIFDIVLEELYNLPCFYNEFIRSIAIDADGNRWFGSSGGGLIKFDGSNLTRYQMSNSGIPENRVLSVAIDKYGNKWAGTYGGGLAMFDGLNWKVYNYENTGLPVSDVWAIAIDKDDNKWLACETSIVKFDGKNWTNYTSRNSGLISGLSVNSITIDRYNNKWIGTGYGLSVFNENGVITSAKNETAETPNSFSLSNNYPNPFNPSTTINYSIKTAGHVSLKVFDLLGREVASLVDEYKNPGTYSVNFNAGKLSSGVYIYRIQAGGGEFSRAGKMTLLK